MCYICVHSKAVIAHGNACHCVIDRIIVAQHWLPLYEESSPLTYPIARHFGHVKADESKRTFYCLTSVVDAMNAVLVLPCGMLLRVVWQIAVFYSKILFLLIVLKINAAVSLDLVCYRTSYMTSPRK
jgi:hypothetical protein